MYAKYYEEQKFEGLRIDSEVFTDCEFTDCEFVDCVFLGCNMVGCSFISCIFTRCEINKLSANNCSRLQYAEFYECNLISITWSELLPTSGFAEPISKMSNCNLRFNTFSQINFNKFNFAGSAITESMFSECPLTDSKFNNCKLEKTEFFKCDLRKSDFANATGYRIDITSNKLTGAKFSFPEVVNLLSCLGIKII